VTVSTEAPSSLAPSGPSPSRRTPRVIRLAGAAAAILVPFLGRARARETVGWTYAVLTLIGYSIQTQYSRAIFGVLWTLIAPALLIAIYLPALTVNGPDPAWVPLLGEGRLAFPIYVMIGFLVYGGFCQAIQNGASSLVSSPEVVHHSPIPLSILPLVKVAQALVGLILSLAVVGMLIVATNGWPGTRVFLLIPALLGTFLVTLGFALFLSVLAVLFRDVLHMLSALLLVEFFAVPLVYLPSKFGGIHATIIQANPLTPLLNLFRAGLLPSYPWSWLDLGLAAAWSLPALLVGKLMFRRLLPSVVEHA
jgi:ABC-2 type transport system permease protein